MILLCMRLPTEGMCSIKIYFFSKHVAMLTLFIVPEVRPFINKLMIANILIVTGLILLQRVYYDIDGKANDSPHYDWGV